MAQRSAARDVAETVGTLGLVGFGLWYASRFDLPWTGMNPFKKKFDPDGSASKVKVKPLASRASSAVSNVWEAFKSAGARTRTSDNVCFDAVGGCQQLFPGEGTAHEGYFGDFFARQGSGHPSSFSGLYLDRSPSNDWDFSGASPAAKDEMAGYWEWNQSYGRSVWRPWWSRSSADWSYSGSDSEGAYKRTKSWMWPR